jgi:AAA15 family ATPase/GTPase
MERIAIKSLGPIKHFQTDVKKFTLLIGPQASGKSTISKSVYFFKSLRDELLRYLLDAINHNQFDKTLGTYAKRIRQKYLEFWGPTYHQTNFIMAYEYAPNTYIKIKRKGVYIDPVFSEKFKQGFFDITNKAEKFVQKLEPKSTKFMSSREILAHETERRGLFADIEKQVNNIFSDDRDLIFIPAGRSLVTTLSDQLQAIHPFKLDYVSRAFIERINNSKPQFNKSLQEMVVEKKKLTQQVIDFDKVDLADRLVSKILKAKYIFDHEGEKLYYAADKYTKLNYASSGQQESIWILLLIFLLILDDRKVFIVFEEPEAHLYPIAQKDMVQLISLLGNHKNSQVIITTHSPYILSSFNNLIYANILGATKPRKVGDIIDKSTWVNPKEVDAYYISEGIAKSIIDEETKLIRGESIDTASQNINEEFLSLFELDDKS